MKYRQGFVSNSSSSSFMGGIGIIKDFEKFEKWKASFDRWDRESITVYDEEESWHDVFDSAGMFSVSMPVNSEPEVSISKKEIEKHQNNIPIDTQAKNKLLGNDYSNVVYFIIGNDEGDNAFLNDERDDLNYDIDLDHFDNDQQRLYKEFGSDKSGIVCGDKMFGADRNG